MAENISNPKQYLEQLKRKYNARLDDMKDSVRESLVPVNCPSIKQGNRPAFHGQIYAIGPNAGSGNVTCKSKYSMNRICLQCPAGYGIQFSGSHTTSDIEEIGKKLQRAIASRSLK